MDYFRFIDKFPQKTNAFTLVLKIFRKLNITHKDLLGIGTYILLKKVIFVQL